MAVRSGLTLPGRNSLTRVAFGRADHGIGDAGVAAGAVQQDFVVGQRAAADGLAHDVGCGTIFDAAAGIHPFGFGVYADILWQMGGYLTKAQERCVPDQAVDIAGIHMRNGMYIQFG